jgi:hypothetical protein
MCAATLALADQAAIMPSLAPNPSFLPSFLCIRAESNLALLICQDKDLSLLQFLSIQTRQALLQQSGVAALLLQDYEMDRFYHSVFEGCGIPRPPPSPTLQPELKRCITEKYNAQISKWAKRLSPPAAQEAKRSVRDQVDLQSALQNLGYLDGGQRIDGVYGPNTRSAVLQWQRAEGLPETGFLDDISADRLAKIDTSARVALDNDDCFAPLTNLDSLVCQYKFLRWRNSELDRSRSALRQQVGRGGKDLEDFENRLFIDDITDKCQIGTLIDHPSLAHFAASCVEERLRTRKLEVESRLQPIAREEAMRPVAQQLLVERALFNLGYLAAQDFAKDGVLGDDARFAIVRWQLDNGLVVSGLLGEEDASRLLPFSHKTSSVVLACLQSGMKASGNLPSERDIHQCTGSWIAPQTIVRCIFDYECPLRGDSEQDRLAVQRILAGRGLTFDEPLKILEDDFPEIPEKQAVVTCNTQSKLYSDFMACIADSSEFPQKEIYSQLKRCVQTADGLDQLNCLAATPGILHLPFSVEDARKLSECIAYSARRSIPECVLGGSDAVKYASKIQSCLETAAATTGEDAAKCLPEGVGGDAGKIVKCATEAEGDRIKLAACAANGLLSPEQSRLFSCASESQGLSGFALCAAAPSMNEEWRTVAECAAETGGQPYALAGCAATRLTWRELTKCFTGKIGQDCYGPNNTIVVTVQNALHDATQGVGKGNEVVKVRDWVEDRMGIGGDARSVINDPFKKACNVLTFGTLCN